MGITGLLPLLKPVTKDVHISELKGLTVGIDTYCWLHKGIYSCSAELCQGLPTDKFIKYCVERVHLLLSHGVKPYLVFDGGYLPAKAGKEEERRARRESNLQRGMQLMREGHASGAHQFFCKAADVTPFMAHQVIQVVKRIPGVQYVVAPYEADAQLGFLARNGHVDAVITEDSDIMLFGCNRVVFKLERDGTGQEVDLSEVFSRRNDELDMRGMNEDDLMTLCALSGCDYLPSVHGMGLKKAYRMVSRHKELPKILRAVKFDSGRAFPRGYEADFQRALLTFRHQRAFDPVSRTVVHMTPLPESLPPAILAPAGNGERGSFGLTGHAAALAFLGPPVAQERGCAVADGEVDPITGEAFSGMGGEGVADSTAKTPESALSEAAAAALAAWRGNPTSAPGGSGAAAKKKQLSAQGNNLTKYWGAPVSSKKPRPRYAVGGRGGDGGGIPADRSFEFGTPDRPSRGWMVSGGEGGASGTTEATGGRPNVRAKAVDPDRASPASLSSCVSPGSFYTGASESPSSPPATSGGTTSGDVGTTARDGKENQAPLSPRDDGEPPDEANDLPATSKFFGGGGGGGGGGGDNGGDNATVGGKGLSLRQSGLRRRFRPPHAAPRCAASAAAASRSCSTLGRGRGSNGGGEANQDDEMGEADPWGAEYAYPRLDASRVTAGGDQRPFAAGKSGSASAAPSSGGGGRRLKRRRTLGVGSLVPSGMIRGLEGAEVRGLGGPGRRSKSLGAATANASSNLKTVAANDNGGSDVDDDDDDDGNTRGDRYVSNLFERFAARVPATRSPARKRAASSAQPEPSGTTGEVAETTAAASCRTPGTGSRGGEASGVSEGEDTGGDVDDDVGNARDALPVAAAPSSPSSARSNKSRGNRACPGGRASPAGGARDDIFNSYRAGCVDKNGEDARSTASDKPARVGAANSNRRKSGTGGGAGGRKMALLHESAAATPQAVAAAVRRNKGATGVAGVIGVSVGVGVGVTPDMFEQFAYSPSD